MAILPKVAAKAKILSKGLDVFNQAPEQVKKQIIEGDEQGIKYLEGKHVKRQEIDQAKVDAERQRLDSDIEAGYISEREAEDEYSRLSGMPALGEDPYEMTRLGQKYSHVTPPTANQGTYEEVGYQLPSGMLTDEAKAVKDHWGGNTTAHVRRDTSGGALRVYEIQSDVQNQLSDVKATDPREDNFLNKVLDFWDELGLDERPGYPLTESFDEHLARGLNPDERQAILSWLNTPTDYKFDKETITNFIGSEESSALIDWLHNTSAFQKNIAKKPKMSQYNINWTKDVINRQFKDAADQGLDKVDFLIKPEGGYMVRSEQVQKTYEDRIVKQVQNLAKKLKGPNGEKAIVEWVTPEIDTTTRKVIDKKVMADSIDGTFGPDDFLEHLAENIDTLNSGQQRQITKFLKDYNADLKAPNVFDNDDFYDMVHDSEVLDFLVANNDKLNFMIPAESKGDKYLRVNLPKVAGGTALAGFTIPAFAQETEESKQTNLSVRVKKAKAAGHKATDVATYLAGQVDPNALSKVLRDVYSDEIAKAKEAGYSEEEINNYLQVSSTDIKAPDSSVVASDSGPNTNSIMFEDNATTDVIGAQGPDLVQRESPIDQLDPNAAPVKSQPTTAEMQASILPGLIPDQLLPEDVKKAKGIEQTPEELLKELRTITDSQEEFHKSIGGDLFNNPEWTQQAEQIRTKANSVISSELEKRGIPVQNIDEYGVVTITNPNTGIPEEVDVGFWDSIESIKGELTGSVSMALAGAKAGASAMPIPHPLAKAAGAFVGAVVGGAGGAALGRRYDILEAAQELKLKVATDELKSKMGEAAYYDAVYSIGVPAVVKVGGMTARGIGRAWDLLFSGNKEGAKRALQDVFQLSDEKAITMVERWENLNKVKLLTEEARTKRALTNEDIDIVAHVLTETNPEAVGLTKLAAARSKTAGSKYTTAVTKRADDLQAQVSVATPDNIDVVLKDSLERYEAAVQKDYDTANQLGISLMEDTGYRFNFNKSPVSAVFNELDKDILDSDLKRKFWPYLQRLRAQGGEKAIRDLKKQAAEFGEQKGLKNVIPKLTSDQIEAANPMRGFNNLLETYRIINEVSRMPGFKGRKSERLINSARQSVDAEIKRAVEAHMPHWQTWYKQWREVNIEYAKMARLHINLLYKAIMANRANKESVVRTLLHTMTYTDPSTYKSVLGKLPDTLKNTTENAIIKGLTDKYTIGFEDGAKAIDFVKLANDLDGLDFTRPQARQFKRMIGEYAKVYKADPQMLSVSGHIPLPKFQSYLTADPMVRLKFEIASESFHFLKSKFGNEADKVGLVDLVAKLIDNPLDSITTKKVLKNLPEDAELRTLLHKYKLQYAQKGAPESYEKIPVHKVASPGQAKVVRDTKLGRGILYQVDEARAKHIQKQTGGKLHQVEINPKLIATPEDVANLLGREPTLEDFKNPDVVRALKLNKNKQGIAYEDEVLLFED